MRKSLVAVLTLTAVLFSSCIFLPGCTGQQSAKSFGGSTTIELPKGKKLVGATWKGDADLWYLVRDMRPDEQPETTEFIQSKGGMVNLTGNGKVIFKESR